VRHVTESAREHWNERRAGGAFEPFPDAPAEWLVAHRALLQGGGRALDVACGDGRNALYLARLGYEVDAVDVSDVAIDALGAAARERGLAIHPRLVDLEHEPLAPAGARYDVVMNFNYLQRDLFDALADALAPGGLLLFETIGRAHIDELGRDFNPAFVVERHELLHAFGTLDVVNHHDGVVERSGRERGVASLVARRPVA